MEQKSIKISLNDSKSCFKELVHIPQNYFYGMAENLFMGKKLSVTVELVRKTRTNTNDSFLPTKDFVEKINNIMKTNFLKISPYNYIDINFGEKTVASRIQCVESEESVIYYIKFFKHYLKDIIINHDENNNETIFSEDEVILIRDEIFSHILTIILRTKSEFLQLEVYNRIEEENEKNITADDIILEMYKSNIITKSQYIYFTLNNYVKISKKEREE